MSLVDAALSLAKVHIVLTQGGRAATKNEEEKNCWMSEWLLCSTFSSLPYYTGCCWECDKPWKFACTALDTRQCCSERLLRNNSTTSSCCLRDIVKSIKTFSSSLFQWSNNFSWRSSILSLVSPVYLALRSFHPVFISSLRRIIMTMTTMMEEGGVELSLSCALFCFGGGGMAEGITMEWRRQVDVKCEKIVRRDKLIMRIPNFV